MAGVKIDQFHGIYPRIHPSLLGDGMAVTAHNCRLKNGKLVPLRMPSKLDGKTVNLENGLDFIKDAKSLHIWKHDGDIEFLAFPGICDIAEGNIADDEYNRVFLSGETGATWIDNSQNPAVTHTNVPVAYLRKSGGASIIRHPLTKAPLPPPYAKLSTSNGAPEDADNIRYTRFFQTWVDPFGYESGYSDASLNWHPDAHGEGQGAYTSDDLEYNDGEEVSFLALTDAQVPDGGGSVNAPTPGYKRRIYKVVAGTEVGMAKFVAEFATDPWGAKTVKIKDEDTGEVMPEIEPIPTDLQNMIYIPGGFYAGFSTRNPKTVMFSDIGNPTNWPTAYRYDVEDNIVALIANTNSVFVLTDGFPYVISGTAPESMTVAKIAGIAAACVSKRSVCLVKNACCYASNIGICMISPDPNYGTIVQNITDKIWTKEQWQAMNPMMCLMAQFDSALHCFFPLLRKGYIIDLLESENAVTEHDEMSSCLCTDNREDVLYFVREGE